ncbi:helix-turn-helix transcriptional regulator [Natronorubrum halophilum]|uniref:helix-turn-helix transcriptional regulator n=1 Tax=Natronorubrum halophilum TaxID=1702106 RepID=UPI0010C1C40A|nr:ArsR family transcriptional regulator [Natronorubrum halophilum]
MGEQAVQRREPPRFDSLVRCLAKSAPLLEALRDGPEYKGELAAELGVSKSTVYNQTRELRQQSLVEQTSDGYRLTNRGHLHAELYRDAMSLSKGIYGAGPLLEGVPTDELPPTSVIRDAEVVTTETSPEAPLNAFLEWLDRAGHVSGLAALVYPRSVDALATKLDAELLTVDLVIESATLDSLVEHHRTDCRAVIRSAESVVAVTDDSLPFGLFIVDAPDENIEVGVTTYTERGHICSFGCMTSDESIEWARNVRERYRSRARPIAATDHVSLLER